MDTSINCLEEILANLSKGECHTQLKIPIMEYQSRAKPLNSLAWVKKIAWCSNGKEVDCTSPAKARLIHLLEKFGAKEDEVIPGMN